MSDQEALAQLRMVGDSAADFAAAHGGATAARRVHEGAAAHDMQGGAATWRLMAELGWFGIAVAEEHGGLGLGAPALCRVAQEVGRQLMVPPLTMGMAAAAVLAQAHANPADAAAALHGLLAGERQVAMAQVSDTGVPPGPYSLNEQPAGGGLSAWLVPDGDTASAFLLALDQGDRFEARLLHAEAPAWPVMTTPPWTVANWPTCMCRPPPGPPHPCCCTATPAAPPGSRAANCCGWAMPPT